MKRLLYLPYHTYSHVVTHTLFFTLNRPAGDVLRQLALTPFLMTVKARREYYTLLFFPLHFFFFIQIYEGTHEREDERLM